MFAVWDHPPQPTDYVPSYLPWRALLWAAWVLLLLAGTVGLAQRFLQGHLPAGYGSYVPWGLCIAIYFHGVGMAGGAFFIGALGYVLNWPGFQLGKNLRLVIVLEIAAIVPAFFAVWLDLGHLDRFQSIFPDPNFTSMMAFNTWMYSVFMGVAGVCWLPSYLKDAGWKPAWTAWLKPLLCPVILFAMLFPSQSGAFFGVVDGKKFELATHPGKPATFDISSIRHDLAYEKSHAASYPPGSLVKNRYGKLLNLYQEKTAGGSVSLENRPGPMIARCARVKMH